MGDPSSSSLRRRSLRSSNQPPSKTSASDASSFPPSSSKPLPNLPRELHREILRFCDPSTLATCCLVDLALLQISAEILYDNVELRGFERMESFFCTRTSPPGGRVSRILTLHRIRALTLIVSEQKDQPTDLGHLFLFHRDRFAKSSHPQLVVNLLTLHVPSLLSDDQDTSLQHKECWWSLLRLFDPCSLSIIGYIPKKSSKHYFPELEFDNQTFPNLRLLTLKDHFPSWTNRWEFLRNPSESRAAMKVVLVLTETMDEGEEDEEPVEMLVESLGVGNWLRMDPTETRVREVVVQTVSKERRARLEKDLQSCWESWERQEKWEVWKSRLKYEVVEA